MKRKMKFRARIRLAWENLKGIFTATAKLNRIRKKMKVARKDGNKDQVLKLGEDLSELVKDTVGYNVSQYIEVRSAMIRECMIQSGYETEDLGEMGRWTVVPDEVRASQKCKDDFARFEKEIDRRFKGKIAK